MSVAHFMPKEYINNPIKILHHLKEAGFTQRQAEAQVEVLADYIDSNLATKKDIAEIRREIKELELKLTIKLSSIVGIIVGFFYTLEKFF